MKQYEQPDQGRHCLSVQKLKIITYITIAGLLIYLQEHLLFIIAWLNFLILLRNEISKILSMKSHVKFGFLL